MKSRHKAGFTLIEILLVIGLIAALAVASYVALDPSRRFRDARDARRVSDIETILSAVHQYIIDNRGALPPGIDTIEKQIGVAESGCQIEGACAVTEDACIDLSGELSRYLKTMPEDPASGTSERTHYSIILDGNDLITVTACDAEALDEPSVSR